MTYIEGAKMRCIYLLVQFSSLFCKYLALKFRWSAIKCGSTLVHTTLNHLNFPTF